MRYNRGKGRRRYGRRGGRRIRRAGPSRGGVRF